VPTIDLPADELAAVAAAIRRLIEDDKFPHAPRLDPLRAALARLEAAAEPTADPIKFRTLRSLTPKAPPQAKPPARAGRSANRRPRAIDFDTDDEISLCPGDGPKAGPRTRRPRRQPKPTSARGANRRPFAPPG
jgi:hypothetical protein